MRKASNFSSRMVVSCGEAGRLRVERAGDDGVDCEVSILMMPSNLDCTRLMEGQERYGRLISLGSKRKLGMANAPSSGGQTLVALVQTLGQWKLAAVGSADNLSIVYCSAELLWPRGTSRKCINHAVLTCIV